MINNVVLVGRLTKDPELRQTQSGVSVARFTLAVNRPFSSQNGEKQADFINVVVWRKQAENVANYLSKGSLAGVQGRIQTGSYEGQDGKRVYTVEVIADSVQFLDKKSEHGNANGTPAASTSYQQPQQPSYQQSSYQQPQQPSYQQPSYQQPQQPSYQQPSYQQPQQPSYQQSQSTTAYEGVQDDDLPF